MSKSHIDLQRALQSFSGVKLTTFQQRVGEERNSARGKVILEYLNTFISPDKSSPYNLGGKSYYNQVYTDTGTITEETERLFLSSRDLKKFDAYVLINIKEAVKKGIIKTEDLDKSEFFVDMVDIAEKEMEVFDAKGKTPSRIQMNSILKNALREATNRVIKEDMTEGIAYDLDRKNAEQQLTQYALQIPIETIEAHKPIHGQKREPQMIALYQAYQNGNMAGNFGRRIDETNNTIDIMQYVLSNDSRFKYEGDIAVSQDDIIAVARVSELSKNLVKQVREGKNVEGISRFDSGISFMQMLDIADNLLAMGDIIREESGQKHLSLSQVLPENVTETVGRAILSDRVNNIDSFSELAESQRVSIVALATGFISKTLGLDKQRDNSDINR